MNPFLLAAVLLSLFLSCGSDMAQGTGTTGFATPARISSRVLPAALNQVFIHVHSDQDLFCFAAGSGMRLSGYLRTGTLI